MVTLSRIEGFYWVARTQGYSRAARAFPYPITQPGVHQQVRKLEEEMGVKLFDRVGKDRVVLTAAGRTLYDHVSPFLEKLPQVVAASQGSLVSGLVRIQAAGQVLRMLLPAWLSRVRQKYKELDIELEEVTDTHIEALRRGETDVVVDYLPDLPPDLSAQRVGTVYVFIAAPATDPATRKRAWDLAAFAEQPFIAYHPHRKHRALQMQALEINNIVPKRIIAASSSDTIMALTQAGLGYSLVPSLSRKGPRWPGVKAQRLRAPVIEFPVWAAWRSSGESNPLIRALLEQAPIDVRDLEEG